MPMQRTGRNAPAPPPAPDMGGARVVAAPDLHGHAVRRVMGLIAWAVAQP